ncbi:MAG: hypothetical protein JWO69_234 [Thermoleophilia bacterium]|jgi:Flp pilus assembly protein TadB|nr:hypothetical protein [Thermoleophilia bacterium]
MAWVATAGVLLLLWVLAWALPEPYAFGAQVLVLLAAWFTRRRGATTGQARPRVLNEWWPLVTALVAGIAAGQSMLVVADRLPGPSPADFALLTPAVLSTLFVARSAFELLAWRHWEPQE